MLGRKESNLQPSASEAAALPVAPLPNAGAEGVEPSAGRFKGGRSTVELRPKSNVMDGVRIELTMLALRAAGLRPAGPPLVTSRPCSPRARAAERATFTTAIRAVRERRRRAGGGNRTRFSGKASRCPTNGRHPRVHGRKESNLQQRVLEARALTDGASAVEGCARRSAEMRRGRGAFATRPREGLRRGERSRGGRHAKAQGERLVLVTLEVAVDDLVDAQRRAGRRDRRARFGAPLRTERD